MKIRLQKHIAELGICSRRKAEDLIRLGQVTLNGVVVTEMGVQVDPETDAVEVVGAVPKRAGEKLIYIALNKPIDYISSTSNEQGASVLSLLTKENNIKPKLGRDVTERVYPVGRLDKDSEGLVLLTNDGTLTNTLTHPRYAHEKEYEVMIHEPLSKDAKKILSTGMLVNDEHVNGIRIVNESILGKRVFVTVILTEGKNRQIRKMFGKLGYRIFALKRTRINKLKLLSLPPGRWRFIRKSDIV
ncbi:MAG: rRNA pseudouridine synthase [Candidatus Magasanikbacteria bacterium]|uniref:Pseudouridine synthase n=1 Tax=Candidatus Magasanikbacteria bacterium CG10_big_fil_rev_8_21_14_0_10_38_6 TaxID=1974647 RepID=A0A2M6NZX5_9BACT|nr:rRNA pseudouridine synthase [Candidatus Magasanikbacteria bacterium]NCS72175.1 rRNA pseudouridine synthase [Candidatus Magasanikbacteria bacterium]PIR76849.1 MAG: pseudouridine synthase [Candidatus Magasanikbacteria bacterium CG10_big_fil_rev_8_21_14_0_10_38_6]